MLNLNISAKDISLDEPLRMFVYQRIGGLEKYLRDMGEVSVDVQIGKSTKHHQSGPFMYAEANMHIGGQLLRATCEHEDLRNAIVDVKEELKAQIMKFKGKMEYRERKKQA